MDNNNIKTLLGIHKDMYIQIFIQILNEGNKDIPVAEVISLLHATHFLFLPILAEEMERVEKEVDDEAQEENQNQ